MASSKIKQYLCNQVDDIAGNEVSPTKQARGVNYSNDLNNLIVCVWS